MEALPPLDGPGLHQSPAKTYSQTVSSPKSQTAISPSSVSISHAVTTTTPVLGSVSPVREVIDGSIEIEIPSELLIDAQPLWSKFIMGHFIGDAPHIGKVHATVNRIWASPEKTSMIDAQFLSSKTVLFRIEDDHMRQRVLRRHFWHIADIPLVVREWNPSTANSKPDLSAIPIWVDLKCVPDYLFNEKGLQFLGDQIGKMQRLHPNTARCVRLDVARLLVVVNLEKALPDKLNLKSSGQVIEVSYPWLPSRCSECQDWGHEGKNCSKMKKGAAVESPVAVKVMEKSGQTAEESSTEVHQSSQQSPIIAKEVVEESTWSLVKNGGRASPGKVGSGSPPMTELQVDVAAASPSRFQILAETLEEGECEPDVQEQEEERQIVSPKTIGSQEPSVETTRKTKSHRGRSKSRPKAIVTRKDQKTSWRAETNYDYHRLGRIWVCWREDITVHILYKSSQIITCWVTSESGEQFVVSCIYASNFHADRMLLWEEIRQCDQLFVQSRVPWIVMGDFNETLASSEHSRGTVLANVTAGRGFQALISDCELEDLSYVGPRFTWWNNQEDNPIGKKLDRALVNGVWGQVFPSSYASFETCGVSDHCRCSVNFSELTQSVRRPFKYFSYLGDLPQFGSTVQQEWDSLDPLYHSRAALFIFHRKLKTLKAPLRALNREKYGDLPRRTREAFDELCACQNRALTSPSAESFAEVSEATNNWNHLAGVEERFYRQKSRLNSLKYGDQNTAFFHRMTQTHASKNAIKRLKTQAGVTITEISDIKSEAVSHFQQFLQARPANIEEVHDDYLADLLSFRCSATTAASLVREINAEEIKSVLFSMPSSKAPGPDGYPVEFYKSAWSIIGSDFIKAVQSFFIYGFMPRGVNATILSLIPKTTEPESIKDYRPIACCNMLYKVVSKILANRLKELLPSLIEPNQTAFIKDRLLLENVLLASELVKDYHKVTITPRSVIKLDISKAFDTVEWSFISAVLRTWGLPDQFVNWVTVCLSTASFSVAVNGELAGFFPSSRGLRQGCSLSPYLYVIVNNVLSLLLNRAAQQSRIGYHPRCKDMGLTHLSFADDILVFTDGSASSLQGIMTVLEDFGRISGLFINTSKSSIFTAGRNTLGIQEEAERLGIPKESLPIRYLGLPLTTKTMTRQDYEPLVDRIRSRFLCWSSKRLSFAGRLQLIQSVITSVINFWCSIFRLPKGCFDVIGSMCNAFLWSGSPTDHSKTKVAWEDVCKPKEEGGLGIRRLRDSSRVFALSLIWRLFTASGSLWVAWSRRYLFPNASFWSVSEGTLGSWIWRKLLKLRPLAASLMCMEVKNGNSTMFWWDNWTGAGRLIDIVGDIGPQHFGLSRHATVSEACINNQWTLRRARGQLYRTVIELLSPITPPSPHAGQDIVKWMHKTGEYQSSFSSKCTWNLIRDTSTKVSWSTLVWFPQGVPRYSFITWLAVKDRLSTGQRMRRWGQIQFCPLCGERDETRDHIFFACPYVFAIWSTLCTPLLRRHTTPDWHDTVRAILAKQSPRIDIILVRMVFQTTIYFVWRERNGRIHNSSQQHYRNLTKQIASAIALRIQSLNYDPQHKNAPLLARWSSLCSSFV
ncbi:Reverse transcriptase domain [Arabidopsis thaliana x Arabidopsis arenosa]|nr:Reverse transcriptase domain [Arabidopsis thaliana x Arabidopsis arenosa]